MVTKKTSNEDVKKVSSPVEQKSGDKKEKTAAIATTAKPAARKASTVKTAENKAAKTPQIRRNTAKGITISETASQDVMSSVLETKAKNEAKKNKTVVKTKAVKTVNYEIAADENKGSNAAAVKNKRHAVKENAQKAEAKKFIDMKGEAVEQSSCCRKCCLCEGMKNMFAAWIDGYKKIFDYKSRTNRYDFWAFMLINLIFTILLAIPYQKANMNALFAGQELKFAYVLSYWVVVFIEMLIYLALYIRRLHDMGESGWKGYFRPMTFSALAIIALIVVGQQFSPVAEDLNYHPGMRESFLGLALIILLLINLYYLCKTFIATGFMEEDKEDNAYGVAKLLSVCQKRKFLRYATLYIMFMFIYMIVVWAFIYFMSLSIMLR